MRVPELYTSGRPLFSFEFFPPRTDAGYQSLFRSIAELTPLEPGFVSVTCGAGGSTRKKTTELVNRIQQETGLTAMAHVTCAGRGAEELADSLEEMERGGIENVLALRGDPPADQPDWQPVPGGFRHANELVAFIKSRFGFSLGGACHPEKHHEAPSFEEDLTNLRKKVEAGVEFLITQLFLDNEPFFHFVARAREVGIDVPIVPGIMPMVSLKNLRGAMRLSPGSKMPLELEQLLVEAGEDADRSMEIGVQWATRQCRELLDWGAPGIHFYTLNKSPATRKVHGNLSKR